MTTLDTVICLEPNAAVVDLLSVCDPDAYRGTFRKAIWSRDVLKQRSLASHNARWHTAGSDADDQPLHFGVIIGQLSALSLAERESHLARVLLDKPDSFSVLMTMATLHLNNKERRFVDSLSWYRAAHAVRPKSGVPCIQIGALLFAKGDLDEAIAYYREAFRLDPGLVDAHSWQLAAVHETLAYTLRKQQFWIGAIASLREAIRLDSKRAITHLNLGFALSHEGDLDGAISSYLKALSIDKNFVEAHKQLAVCRDKKGDSEGAIASLHEVIRLEPKNASAHTDLGATLHRKGELREAVIAHLNAIRYGPKLAKAHYEFGSTLCAMRDFEGAVEFLQDAIRLERLDVEGHALLERMDAISHALLGCTFQDQYRLRDSVRELTEAVKLLHPDSSTRKSIQSRLAAVTALLTVDVEKLIEVAAGRATTGNAAEAIRLAQMSGRTLNRFHLAQMLFEEAFEKDPALKNQSLLGHRYQAARCAALAADGKGDDGSSSDPTSAGAPGNGWPQTWRRELRSLRNGRRELARPCMPAWRSGSLDPNGTHTATKPN